MSTPRWPASAASTNWRRCWRWCSTAARKMHDIVPRDELGRSNYRLAAIRPSQIDLDDADVTAFVAEIAERTGEFLQIVNFNLRGSQYAIAGTVRGLEALEEEVERRREITGGKRSFILVPGIDVPFHSSRAAGRRRRLPPLAGARHAARQGSRPDHRAATSRTWCRGRSRWTATSSRRSAIWCPPSRSTRSSPTTTPGGTRSRPSCAARSSSSCWPGSSPARCAGSRRRTCCSSRRPRAASASSGSSRSA